MRAGGRARSFLGRLLGRRRAGAGVRGARTGGAVCLQRTIAPGASADFTFAISWRFPNRTPDRCGWDAAPGEGGALIGNYYCTRFADAWDAARYLADHLDDLERRTRQLRRRDP